MEKQIQVPTQLSVGQKVYYRSAGEIRTTSVKEIRVTYRNPYDWHTDYILKDGNVFNDGHINQVCCSSIERLQEYEQCIAEFKAKNQRVI